MKSNSKKRLIFGVIASLGFLIPCHSKVEVDPAIPSYVKVGGIGGSIDSIGSDTLNNLNAYWAEAFNKVYSNVKIQIEGKGSSTAPPALIQGTSNLGPMSRKMKSKELDAFEKKFGFPPAKIGVALDSLAVYVNKDNPIEQLTLKEVDAIFSKNRKGGHPSDISSWGQVGLSENWANSPISIYGRNSASGTYGYFKKKALFKGDYKDVVKEQPGSASVVMSITEDTNGIGYSGIGYLTSGVKPLSLSKDEKQYYSPTYDNVLSGKYPLGRMLYIYFVKEPNKPVTPVVKEFLKLILSKEGQEIVIKGGYLPLPAKVVKEQLNILES